MIHVTSSRATIAGLLGSLTLLAVQPAFAGIPACNDCSAPVLTGQTTVNGDRNSTQIYGGVQWTFGAGPELVLGVRASHTNASKKTAGAKLEATFPFSAQSITFDKLRLRLFGGTRTVLPELGFGYSFANASWLLSGAVQTDYLLIGTDYAWSSGQWQPFVGLNTLRRPKAPNTGAAGVLGCSDGGELTDVTSLPFVAPEDQVNGFTCVPTQV